MCDTLGSAHRTRPVIRTRKRTGLYNTGIPGDPDDTGLHCLNQLTEVPYGGQMVVDRDSVLAGRVRITIHDRPLDMVTSFLRRRKYRVNVRVGYSTYLDCI